MDTLGKAGLMPGFWSRTWPQSLELPRIRW